MWLGAVLYFSYSSDSWRLLFHLNRSKASVSRNWDFKKTVNRKITRLRNILISNSHILRTPNGWVAKDQVMRSMELRHHPTPQKHTHLSEFFFVCQLEECSCKGDTYLGAQYLIPSSAADFLLKLMKLKFKLSASVSPFEK